MSRWLDIAARAELISKPQPANRQEPAERSVARPEVEFLPVSAGLPVRQIKKDRADREIRKPEVSGSPDPGIALAPDNPSPYGTSPGGRPQTFTGKVVSLDAWRALSDWEKHGANGKVWNGASRQWESLEGPVRNND